ncbi:MAG: hypothetical protein BroJett011_13780 [Chloroflexota bacterium]|nr:MAG: hypothetical protein BroJett011_13780 [Chloroflexota bacterium]
MRLTFKEVHPLTILILLELIVLGLAGCDGSTPTLGQPGQPTLVFIYTDT